MRRLHNYIIGISSLALSALMTIGVFQLNTVHAMDLDLSSLEPPAQTSNKVAATTVPKSYVPDIYTELPAVRDQGPYGTCWAFSSTALAELSVLRQEGLELNLSELQLAYFSYNSVTDPLGGTKGDSYSLGSKTNNFLSMGGSVGYVMYNYAAWVGATEENEAPYSWAEDALKNGLPDYLSYNSDAVHLRNGYIINRETNAKGMKQAIMNYGAVQCSYRDEPDYYDDRHNSFYCKDDLSTNHGVVIVGWDDDFSKDNFATKAPGNGAWLVRNSWGKTAYTRSGYFWISYYDQSLTTTVYAFDCVSYQNEEYYDNNYQYDGSVHSIKIKFSANPYASYANVFKATKEKEELKAVSFSTECTDLDYSVEIYTNLTDPTDPTSGTLECTTNGSTTYGGFYTVPLSETVNLVKGESFSVVIRLTAESEFPVLLAEYRTKGDYFMHCECSAKEGQSFFSSGGSNWKDIATMQIPGTTDTFNCNYRIKAFTNTVSIGKKQTVDISTCRIELPYESTNYTGSAVTPEIKVYSGDTLLTKGTHYTVSYSNNKEVGLASITVKAVDGSAYTGYKIATFNINIGKPATLTLTNQNTSVKLTWSEVPGATGYKVFLLMDGEYRLVKRLETPELSYIDTGKHNFDNGSKYRYYVQAMRVKNGVEQVSNENTYAEILYLSPIDKVTVTNVTKGITVSWAKNTQAAGYMIYRSENGGKFTLLRKVAGSKKVKYVDTKAAVGKKYTYKVVAYKVVNKCTYQSTDSAAETICRVTGVSQIKSITALTSGIKLNWAKNSKVNGYYIYRSDNGSEYFRLAVIGKASTTKYTDKTAKSNGVKYTYRVVGYKLLSGVRYEGPMSSAKYTFFVGKVNLTNAVNSAKSRVKVTWEKLAKITGYEVRVVLGKTTKTVTVKSKTAVSKVISSLKKGKTYSISVRAYRTVKKTNYYGAWSKVLKVRIKK